jgi:hypothetical protein
VIITARQCSGADCGQDLRYCGGCGEVGDGPGPGTTAVVGGTVGMPDLFGTVVVDVGVPDGDVPVVDGVSLESVDVVSVGDVVSVVVVGSVVVGSVVFGRVCTLVRGTQV